MGGHKIASVYSVIFMCKCNLKMRARMLRYVDAARNANKCNVIETVNWRNRTRLKPQERFRTHIEIIGAH